MVTCMYSWSPQHIHVAGVGRNWSCALGDFIASVCGYTCTCTCSCSQLRELWFNDLYVHAHNYYIALMYMYSVLDIKEKAALVHVVQMGYMTAIQARKLSATFVQYP